MTARPIVWAAVLLLVMLLVILAWRLIAEPNGAEEARGEQVAHKAERSGPALITRANPLSTAPSAVTPTSSLSGAEETKALTAPGPTAGATREAGTRAATDQPRRTRPAKPANTALPRAAQHFTAPTAAPASATLAPAASQTMTNTPAATRTAAAPVPTRQATGTSTVSDTPTATATNPPAASATPQPTLAPLSTAEPAAASLSGRILLNGQPIVPGVILILENGNLETVAETAVGDDGRYRFDNLPAVQDSYTVSFSWERNDSYGTEQVVSWAWIGPLPFDGQSARQLPDLDIGLQGLVHNQPEPDTRLLAAAISPATQLAFAWGAHAHASAYWVDILHGSSLERLWRSELAPATTTEFDGQLADGSFIQPGAYWWTIGGRGSVDSIQLTVYSHAAGLRIVP